MRRFSAQLSALALVLATLASAPSAFASCPANAADCCNSDTGVNCQISCSVPQQCRTGKGETCTSGLCQCTTPSLGCDKVLQSIAPCRCKDSSATVSCNVNGCACTKNSLPSALEPTLRLSATWDIANPVIYNPANSDADLRLTRSDGSVIPAATIRSEIDAAAAKWSSVTCCGAAGPVKLQKGPTVDIRAALDANCGEPPGNQIFFSPADPSPGPYAQHNTQIDIIKRIWAQTPSNICPGTSSVFLASEVLATTPTITDPVYHPGRLLRARMVINGTDWHWRLGVDASCVGCFDLRTVLTHELGHFIGYQHSACSSSVLFAQYAADVTRGDLSAEDKDSFCGLDGSYPSSSYSPAVGCTTPTPTTPDPTPPTTQNGNTVGPSGGSGASGTLSGAPRHGSCMVDADCQSWLKCAKAMTGGWCDMPCATNGDCFSGEVCDNNVGGTTFCRLDLAPGVTGTSGVAISPDFCSPCQSHPDCSTGVCVTISQGTNICSGYCQSNGACGTNGTCTATTAGGDGVCVPVDTSCIQSAAQSRPQLNEACGLDTPCGPNLLCVQLVNAPVCLEKCDSGPTATTKCKTDGYACYEVDSANHLGVCFKGAMQEGDSCLIPDTSLCGFSGKLACFGNAAQNFEDAACYKKCGGNLGNTCAQGQTCTVVNSDISICEPLANKPCTLDLGVACSQAADCTSGVCVNIKNAQVCTRGCDAMLQSGCPQGFVCQAVSGAQGGYCFPKGGMPKTANCTPNGKGCGCHESRPEDGVLLVFALLLTSRFLWRRRARALVALALLVFAPSARATTMIDMNGPELAALSDVIVHARVVSVSGRLVAQGRVYTDAELLVLEGMKGVAAGEKLRVSYPGGIANGLGMRVAGQVQLVEGSEVVIYLMRADDGALFPSAMRLGFFAIERRPYDGVRVAHRTTEGLTLLRKDVAGVASASTGGLVGSVTPPREVHATLPVLLSAIRGEIVQARDVRPPIERAVSK